MILTTEVSGLEAMPRNFLQRCFSDWIEKNHSSFSRRPVGVRYRRGGVSFRLDGLPKAVVIYINSGGASVAYEEDGDTLDLLMCFDMDEQKGGDGYYRCGFCVMHAPSLAVAYADRKKLWEMEVFAPLMEWIGQSLSDGHEIQVERLGGITMVQVRPINLDLK